MARGRPRGAGASRRLLGEAARVRRVVVRGLPDATARLAELLAGTVDIALNLDADAVAVVRERADLRVIAPEAELNVGFVAMNQDVTPYGDVRVRRAVAHAVDRQAIVDAFYGPFATLATDFLPPLLWGHAEVEPYRYDPARARTLLAEAGLADGFTTELWYVPVSSPLEPAPQAIAETIASYLADVGIIARPRTKDWNAYLADANAGRLPMYMLGWAADYADPDSFLRTFLPVARYAVDRVRAERKHDHAGEHDVVRIEPGRRDATRSERRRCQAGAQPIPACPRFRRCTRAACTGCALR
ncbi:MAG: ABC transporter substrate-binding protein [Trueperaceae bacterium]|nr:ABC transporter substrate-binding protein [Trueperaceae bacterium]